MLLDAIRTISVNGILVLSFSLALGKKTSKPTWAICGSSFMIKIFKMSTRIAFYYAVDLMVVQFSLYMIKV